jgi:hypothetical protein
LTLPTQLLLRFTFQTADPAHPFDTSCFGFFLHDNMIVRVIERKCEHQEPDPEPELEVEKDLFQTQAGSVYPMRIGQHEASFHRANRTVSVEV